MNKEEKEAINFFNEILDEFKCCKSEYTITREDEYGILKYLSIILKLVDKLQKENKELKDKLTPRPDRPVPVEYQTTIFVDKRNYISKDKIRNKIKELEEEQKGKIWSINTDTKECSYVNINNKREIEVLKELLGE